METGIYCQSQEGLGWGWWWWWVGGKIVDLRLLYLNICKTQEKKRVPLWRKEGLRIPQTLALPTRNPGQSGDPPRGHRTFLRGGGGGRKRGGSTVTGANTWEFRLSAETPCCVPRP